MTYYYQFIFLLLAAGHIYCLQEFPLEDGRTLELSLSEKIKTDETYRNGTQIEELFKYNIKGFRKANRTREAVNWSFKIVSVWELQSNNLHYYAATCNVYLDSPLSQDSVKTFIALETYIWNDICKNSKTVDLDGDLNDDRKKSGITQSKNTQAGDGLDIVFDAALSLARKKVKFNDTIIVPKISVNFRWGFGVIKKIKILKAVEIGNFSTIERVGNVKVSYIDDVLTLNVSLKMELKVTFYIPVIDKKVTVLAPEAVARATIKLDNSKEKCRIFAKDVELNLNKSSSATPTLSKILPSVLKPYIKAKLNRILNKFLKC